MRMSSSLVAPSALAVLSTVLLSGTAVSQTATGPANQLPSITVQAPKQVARPHRPEAGAAGGKHGCSSPDIASPSNATDISSKAGARFSDGEDCRA